MNPGELRCIVEFILTPVNCDLILHFHLFLKPPQSSLSSPIQLFCSPILTKSSLLLLSLSFTVHLSFPLLSFLSLGLFTITFEQASCYFQHWNPVIHSPSDFFPSLVVSVLSFPLLYLYFLCFQSFINHCFFSFNTLSLSLLLPFLYFTLYVHFSLQAPAFPPFFSQSLSSLQIPILPNLFASLWVLCW